MKIFVADAAFSLKNQESSGVAARCVIWQIKKTGIEVSKNPSDCDYIFVSSTHPIESDYLKKFIGYQKPIIVGGAGALSPYAYMNYANYVVLGDGKNVIEAIRDKKNISELSNVYDGKKHEVNINFDFPWACPPMIIEDGSISIFCGRGCKNKCFFCQTGWALKYQENPINPTRLAKILAKKNKISYMSNDLSQHSFYQTLPIVGHGSYSVKYIKKTGLPHARQIRLGIEGVSERLRKYINKSITHDDLVKCTSWLNQNKKGVRWFMIAGLPTETIDDWKELRSAVLKWKKITPKGVLDISFTAWCPDPATPLAAMPLNDDYFQNFLEFKSWFFDGIGWSNRIKLHGPQQPKSRLIKAMHSMALDEKKLYQGGDFGPNDCVNYPYKKAAQKIYQKLRSD